MTLNGIFEFTFENLVLALVGLFQQQRQQQQQQKSLYNLK